MSARDLSTTCDRRILKAFYTQYVAVLLILLVFTVGAFQRAQPTASTPRAPERPLSDPSSSPFGSLTLLGDINNANLRESVLGQLEAVVAVLREHDVRVVIKVPMELESEDVEGAARLKSGLDQLAALEDFFKESGLPAESVRLMLTSHSMGSKSTVVEFEEERHGEYHL